MEKIINVGGRDIKFTATAATPMHYRNVFKGCDIFKDLMKIEEEQQGAQSESEMIDAVDMGIFERIAFIMSGEFKNGKSFEQWLEGFEMLDIMTALPDIMQLWTDNMDTQSIAEKNV